MRKRSFAPHPALSESLLPLREKVPAKPADEGPSVLLQRARKMRHQPTEAEQVLWYCLRSRRFNRYKFRRQMPLGSYIVDFVCLEQKLIIEADGSQHAESEHDVRRDGWLCGQGFRILRFWNSEIIHRRIEVMETIWHAVQGDGGTVTPHPALSGHLLPQGEKGSAGGACSSLLPLREKVPAKPADEGASDCAGAHP